MPEKLLATLSQYCLRRCGDIQRLLLLAGDVQKDKEHTSLVHLDEVIKVAADSSRAVASRDPHSRPYRQDWRQRMPPTLTGNWDPMNEVHTRKRVPKIPQGFFSYKPKTGLS